MRWQLFPMATVFLVLSFWGCDEAAKKRDPPNPTASPSPSRGPLSLPSAAAGGGDTTIPKPLTDCDPAKFHCTEPTPELLAACAKLTPADDRCASKPMPLELYNRIKGVKTDTPATAGKTCKVLTTGVLNVRSAPSKSTGKVVGTLASGSSFTFIEEKNGWIKGKTPDGKEGWACDTCKEGDPGANYLGECKAPSTNLLDQPEPEPYPQPGQNPDGSYG